MKKRMSKINDQINKITSLSLFFIVLLSLFSSVSASIEVDIAKIDSSEEARYILKFKDEPLSVIKTNPIYSFDGKFFVLGENFLKSVLKQKILDYKSRILELHEKAKEEILEILGNNDDDIFTAEFTEVFNGLAIKIPTNFLDRIKNLPYVERISPDRKIESCLSDSVPLINADDVWNLKDDYGLNITGEGITIAIIDSGVDYTHPDLDDNYLGGYDFVNNDDDPMDDYGHGTHCAGIAVGSGEASNYYFVGVAPGAAYYAYKVMDENGDGYGSDFIKALELAIDPNGDGDYSDHVDIVSASIGNPNGNPDDPESLAVDNIVRNGVVVIAAAGNTGSEYGSINSPGCAKESIAVGASTKSDGIFFKSSRGPTSIGTIKPDVLAPGYQIISAKADGTLLGLPHNDDYCYLSGTSMATPHVAGTIALMLQKHPNWTPYEIKMALRNTAVDLGKDINTQGFGRIDTHEAVNLSTKPPVARLNTSGFTEQGSIEIYGTAKSGNFQNYTLYYSNDDEWIKLYQGSEEKIDDILFTWDTGLLADGTYKLKLDVNSLDQKSTDIVYLYFNTNNNDTYSFYEGDQISIDITSDGEPINVWAILRLERHLPRIHYGSSIILKIPQIYFPSVDYRSGEIIIFKLFGDYETSKFDIRVINIKN